MAMNAFIKPAAVDVPEPIVAAPTAQQKAHATSSFQPMSKAAEIAKSHMAGSQITEAPELELKEDGTAGFSEKEATTLRALSALQIKYGHAGEAVPYLMMLRKTNPTDHDAAQLLAKALMKLGRWEQADLVLAEIDSSSSANNRDEINGFVLLYRSIAAYKTRRMADARKWLNLFRAKISGESS